MWKRLSRIAGLLAFVLVTMAGPVMAQAQNASVAEPMPCHEMKMGEQAAPHDKHPVETSHHDCGSACQCPVSHCAAGALSLPPVASPVVYEGRIRTGFGSDQRLRFALSDDLMRPPRA
ncbi:hypothetical protein PQU94_03260 [Asticcacaulis sp. DXS10W]|uniref:CopL family metal-binding regulatory protein n=2 Tax=Asticcacaulis TaxID=76890 RepID=A0ABT5IBC7_9CAUL|nr:DUF2946 family protein [Asticcacaulis currens]MDC7693297.1 hypothetical protein [Asticcacaulis currens]